MKQHKQGCPIIVTGWAASIPRYCTCDSDNTQQGGHSTPDTKEKENWAKIGRVNLRKLVEKNPSMLVDALDSAYIAGHDNAKEVVPDTKETKKPKCKFPKCENSVELYADGDHDNLSVWCAYHGEDEEGQKEVASLTKGTAWEKDTKREIVRSDIVEKRVAELQKYLHDWAIIEPEITLILGNVRRQLIEVYKEAEEGAVLRDGRYRIGYQAGMEAMKQMAVEAVLKKARATDYADRTEYDECAELLKALSLK